MPSPIVVAFAAQALSSILGGGQQQSIQFQLPSFSPRRAQPLGINVPPIDTPKPDPSTLEKEDVAKKGAGNPIMNAFLTSLASNLASSIFGGGGGQQNQYQYAPPSFR